jgi:hypothetical protein
MEIPRKYLALRWIGVIATVAAWLVVALCVIALIWVLANVNVDWARGLLIVLVLLWGVSTFLTLFVRGNVLLLMNDLEHQSRVNAQGIDQVKSLLAKAGTVAPVKAEATAQTGPGSSAWDVARAESKAIQGDTAPAEPKKPESD